MDAIAVIWQMAERFGDEPIAATLNRLGLLNPAFNEAAIAGFEQMSSVTNPSVPLVQRARPS